MYVLHLIPYPPATCVLPGTGLLLAWTPSGAALTASLQPWGGSGMGRPPLSSENPSIVCYSTSRQQFNKYYFVVRYVLGFSDFKITEELVLIIYYGTYVEPVSLHILTASDPSDQPFERGLMHVIWAIGQEHGMYVHSQPSGLEKGTPTVPDFYKPDELKYHGNGDQRGTLSLDFYGNLFC